jgi:SAM-dependent methyltransferase
MLQRRKLEFTSRADVGCGAGLVTCILAGAIPDK